VVAFFVGQPVRTSVREVFALAATRYGRGNPLLAVERPETESLIPAVAGKDVLDLGSGTGHYARFASALGARTAVAVDLTPEMAASGPRPAVVGDAARLPFADSSFDVLVAALLVSFVGDRAALCSEAARVVRAGGVLVVSDLHPVASARGWSRSFDGPSGERLVVDAPPPSVDEHRNRLEAAGFVLETLREPVVDARLEPEFRRAGRSDFAALRGTPLLVCLRAHKGGPDVP
jgi:SAM-dependent methyltransferase